MSEKYTHRLVIGDWSGDGHRQSDFYPFEASHGRKQIVAAYKQSANKAGISVCKFDGGPNDVLCSKYEDSEIPVSALTKLDILGITRQDLLNTQHFECEDGDEDGEACGHSLHTWGDGLVNLFLMMVSKSLPDFTYKVLADDKHDCINGFWQQDFNGSIGYGLYF
jgi:hypothetical protein